MSLAGLPLQLLPSLAQAASSHAPLSGMGILALCVLGAVGLGLLLPSARAATPRRVGGAILAVAGLIFAALTFRFAGEQGRSAGWWGSETGVYFWAFAIISIVSAVRVITHAKPVYSALYFVMTVFASAGLFVLLNAQFMAAALVLIYAGAVLVTYVFVIMLAAESTGGTGTVTAGADVDAISRDPFLAGAVGFTLMAVLLMSVFDVPSLDRIGARNQPDGSMMALNTSADPNVSPAFQSAPPVAGDTQRLGRYLYQDQMVSVQVAMLVLTLAMTGAVIIARRRIYVAAPLGGASGGGKSDVLSTPATPSDDNPHSIPIYGTDNPRAKEYPQT